MKIVPSVIILPVLIILLLVTPVFGSDWVVYSKNVNGSYSVGEIKYITENRVQVLNKLVYTDKGRDIYIQRLRNLEVPTDGYENLLETVDLIEIDCGGEIYRSWSVKEYDKKGDLLRVVSPKRPVYRPIIPGSSMNILRKILCE